MEDSARNLGLVDQLGTMHRLKEYEGSWLLLYFYPKNDTPGCTVEACSIRDNWHQFTQVGLEVIGVSGGSVGSHQRFAEKHSLPFTLLVDDQYQLSKAFGAYGEKSFFGKKIQGIKRMSFLIDPQGKITKTYPKVNPLSHAKTVLADFKQLSAN